MLEFTLAMIFMLVIGVISVVKPEWMWKVKYFLDVKKTAVCDLTSDDMSCTTDRIYFAKYKTFPFESKSAEETTPSSTSVNKQVLVTPSSVKVQVNPLSSAVIFPFTSLLFNEILPLLSITILSSQEFHVPT